MNAPTDGVPGPALLGYDGSDAARGAIASAGRVLGGREAVVVTVWETVGSAILRNLPPGATGLARDARGIAEDVVEELDAATAEGAEAMAAEGAELATTAGFVARPVARRAVARAAERNAVTVWRALLDAAEEEAAELIVLGSRGRSAVTSTVLGSVSYGVVNNSDRPVLIIPPDPGQGAFPLRHLARDVVAADQVLQQHLQRVQQPRHVVPLLKRAEPEGLVRLAAGVESRAGADQNRSRSGAAGQQNQVGSAHRVITLPRRRFPGGEQRSHRREAVRRDRQSALLGMGGVKPPNQPARIEPAARAGDDAGWMAECVGDLDQARLLIEQMKQHAHLGG